VKSKQVARIEARMRKVDSDLAAIFLRLDAMDRAAYLARHEHDWNHTKTKSGSPDSFGGVMTFYSWKCRDERCGQSGGTNTLGHVPDHYPRDLR
jgi:hypothetical protein